MDSAVPEGARQQLRVPAAAAGEWAPRRVSSAGLVTQTVSSLRRSLALTDRAPLVVVAAHPYDEVTGCGLLIAAWGARGGRCLVLQASALAACQGARTREQSSAAVRAGWLRALRELGVRDRRELGLPSGALDDDVPVLESAVEGAMAALARNARDALVVAPDPGAQDGDHAATGRAARAVARRLGARFAGYSPESERRMALSRSSSAGAGGRWCLIGDARTAEACSRALDALPVHLRSVAEHSRGDQWDPQQQVLMPDGAPTR